MVRALPAGRGRSPRPRGGGDRGGDHRDDQRDAEYTRALGRRLAAAYPQLTVLHATSVVARAVYDQLAQAAGTRDIYRLLRAPSTDLSVEAVATVAAIERLRQRFLATPSAGALHPAIAGLSAAEILDDAIRGFGTYHRRPIASRRGDRIIVGDLQLLYYYQNRTSHLKPEGPA